MLVILLSMLRSTAHSVSVLLVFLLDVDGSSRIFRTHFDKVVDVLFSTLILSSGPQTA